MKSACTFLHILFAVGGKILLSQHIAPQNASNRYYESAILHHGDQGKIIKNKKLYLYISMRKNAAIIKKETSENKKSDQKKPYLTKRLLVSAAKRGIRKAAEETMQIMGYNVIAKDGWVVKIFADGSTEKISQIELVKKPNKLKLD